MSQNIRPEVKSAVALYYDGKGAPQITAKGQDKDAEEIIRLAQEHNVPLCDNPLLVELLAKIELGERIPQELYIAVAHIIAFAYQIKYPNLAAPINPLDIDPLK